MNNIIADIGNYVLDEDLDNYIRNTFNQQGNVIEQINQADVVADEEERRINREIEIEENEERQIDAVVDEPMRAVDDDDEDEDDDDVAEEMPPLMPINYNQATLNRIADRFMNNVAMNVFLNNNIIIADVGNNQNTRETKKAKLEIYKLNDGEIKLSEITLQEICDGKFDNRLITTGLMTQKEKYYVKYNMIESYLNYKLFDCGGSIIENLYHILLDKSNNSDYSSKYFRTYMIIATKTTGLVNLNDVDISYINDKFTNIMNNLEEKEGKLFNQLQDIVRTHHPELFTLNDFSIDEIRELKQILQNLTLTNAELYYFIEKYLEAYIDNYYKKTEVYIQKSNSSDILKGNIFSRNILKLSTFALYIEELYYHKSFINSYGYKRTKEDRKLLKPLYLKFVSADNINIYDYKIKKMTNRDINNVISNFDKYEEIINTYIPYDSLFKMVDDKIVIDYSNFDFSRLKFNEINIKNYYILLKLNYDMLEYERIINILYHSQAGFMNDFVSKNWQKMVEIKPFHQIENKFCDNNCLICLQEFTKDIEVVKLQCGHLYEKECIAQWIKDSKSIKCPTCNDESL